MEAQRATSTWIIITAIVVVAAGLTLAAASLLLWNRPVELPTYAAARWSGDADLEIDSVTVLAPDDATVCPSAVVVGEGTVGLIFVDDWNASIPSEEDAAAGETPWISSALTAQTIAEVGDYTVSARLLDLRRESDTALAETWMRLCGTADAYALVAPDGVAGAELVAR